VDAADGSWQRAKARFTDAWQRHQEKWTRPEEKPSRDERTPEADRQLELACERIQAGEPVVTSQLKSIEAQRPGGRLAGLQFRLKGHDRLIQKAENDVLDKPGRSVEAALTLIPDAVRYTFRYETKDYTAGVRSDLGRLDAAGFEMLKLKNFWSDPEYKGINSQWRDSRTGQRFEVQFHTTISFEAKQLTHDAYERLRNPLPTTSRRETSALHRLQRDVTAKIPQPPGAKDIRQAREGEL
jgi:hypothetical protein